MADPRLVMVLRERVRNRRSRKQPKTIKAAAYPMAAEISYRRELRGFAKETNAIVRKHVLPLILDNDGDGVSDALPLGDLTRAIERARAELGVTDVTARRMSVSNGQRVLKDNTRALNAVYKQALGLEPFKHESGRRLDARKADEVLQDHIKANVALITSIPRQMLGEVEDMLREDFPKGLRVQDLAKKLERRFEIATNRAELIARDQTAKLNGQLTETRNRSLGVTSYVWQTAQDERVRGTPGGLWPKGLHFQLNGQTFRYDDPPVTNDDGDRNHPGEDYQCRCVQIPVLEDALAALGI